MMTKKLSSAQVVQLDVLPFIVVSSSNLYIRLSSEVVVNNCGLSRNTWYNQPPNIRCT